MIETRLHGQPHEIIERAVLFRSFLEYCIYPATADIRNSNKNQHNRHRHRHRRRRRDRDRDDGSSSGVCSDAILADKLRQVDQLHVGITDPWLLKLIRALLMWNPDDRISAADALQHAYFTQPYRCDVCAEEYPTRGEWEYHIKHIHNIKQMYTRQIQATTTKSDGIDTT